MAELAQLLAQTHYFCKMIISLRRRVLSILALLALLFGSQIQSQAQASSEAGWTTLARVTFTKEYDDLLGLKVDKPVFAKAVKELDGKKISLRGYVIPTDGYKSHKEFVFSAYPYSSCFFCGGAGPETVVEVFAKAPIEYSAEAVTISGILKLNSTDPNALMYRLENATLVK